MNDNQEDITANSGASPSPEDNAATLAHVENIKSKKKKKKKKAGTKSPSHTSQQQLSGASESPLNALKGENEVPLDREDYSAVESHTEPPQTILALPTKPDEWFIKPATYDDEGDVITEETFIVLKDGIEIINMPLTEENFSGLIALLNERFPITDGSTEADFFHIRKPLAGSEESEPVMTLTQKNRILATTVLDQKTLKQLIRALQRHVVQTTPVTSWLNKWWHKHKIMRVLLVIAALPVALVILYTIFWGMTH